MRRAILATAVALAALALAACGEKGEGSSGADDELTLALDFYVNPDHAGIYEALELGLFEKAGLEVDPQVPSDPSAPIRQVAAGRADLAISYEPEVLLAHDEGLPVTAVGAIVPRPLTSLISLPAAGIDSPADLRGKTVATAGIPYQAAFMDAILERAGLASGDVQQVDVGFNLLPAVLHLLLVVLPQPGEALAQDEGGEEQQEHDQRKPVLAQKASHIGLPLLSGNRTSPLMQ